MSGPSHSWGGDVFWVIVCSFPTWLAYIAEEMQTYQLHNQYLGVVFEVLAVSAVLSVSSNKHTAQMLSFQRYYHLLQFLSLLWELSFRLSFDSWNSWRILVFDQDFTSAESKWVRDEMAWIWNRREKALSSLEWISYSQWRSYRFH